MIDIHAPEAECCTQKIIKIKRIQYLHIYEKVHQTLPIHLSIFLFPYFKDFDYNKQRDEKVIGIIVKYFFIFLYSLRYTKYKIYIYI